MSTQAAAAIDAAVEAPAATPAAPDTRTPDQRRADDLFGEEEGSGSSPEADLMGVKTWQRGKGGRGRNTHLREDAPAAPRTAKPIPPKAAAPATDPKAGALKFVDTTPTPAPSPEAPDTDPNAEPEFGPLGLTEFVDPETGHTRPGKAFKTREEANHYLATLQGQHRALEGRTRQAVHSAESWKAAHEALHAQHQALLDLVQRGGVPVASAALPGAAPAGRTAPSQSQKADATLLGSMDWKTFSQLLATNPVQAQQWFADTQDQLLSDRFTALESRLRADYEARLSPLMETHQGSQQEQQTIAFFHQMAEVGDESGPAYPELGDAQSVRAIATILDKFPDGFKFTHEGFHAATLMYRDWVNRQGTPRATGLPASPIPQRPPVDNSRAGSVLSGTDTAPRPSAPARVPDRREALLEAISKATAKDTLGFGVRPRS